MGDDGRIREFEMSGHAGFAEEGQDIVCAGVSALSISAVNGLEHFLPVAPKVEERDGYIACQLGELLEQDLEKAQWILQTMLLGIEQIQKAYGQNYILIDRRRWTPC
ncbi:putative ribosomal protein [Desulfosporosinus orientis DSM 765]|uniref:Ribosomal processing cysteine protease Prp n=1 Tax=Desulfosporosinus orientis (strain ATCC 19365 / DSM 765 / NCIMB 8382 / VKM B-1628 / Singapore I) TaxID=768706 RepID=G7WJM3_DESOD|nr:ribosomal-processing cysteine protease Prp [Desulfosporosinus orientis]AET70460.1 putative ribosomal protein [Desulfosporosinus orientis DSM 765]